MLADSGCSALSNPGRVPFLQLAASCKKGTRPGFDIAEQPDKANKMYQNFVEILKTKGLTVQTGVFAANMQVSLVNDGPVTFILEK